MASRLISTVLQSLYENISRVARTTFHLRHTILNYGRYPCISASSHFVPVDEAIFEIREIRLTGLHFLSCHFILAINILL